MTSAEKIKIIADKIFTFIKDSTKKTVKDTDKAIRSHADNFAVTIYQAILDNAVDFISFRITGTTFQRRI